MGLIVRGVAAAIGLARESYVNRNVPRQDGEGEDVEPGVAETEKSADFATSSDRDAERDIVPKIGEMQLSGKGGKDISTSLERSESESLASDEALPIYGSWELDEAQDVVAESSPNVVPSRVIGSRVIIPQSEIPLLPEKFAATYPLTEGAPTMRLGCSIIIPQRRPDSRKRGFIRAYAPLLESKGIPEDTFLDFIATFNIASQANPLLNAINLAGFATFALPLGLSIAVGEAIRLAVDLGIEVQSRYRTNSFLDSMNKLWFLPRGLVCFPMIWKPSVSSLVTNVSMDNTAVEQSESFADDQKTINKFKGGAATTRGNIQFPDAAPLTFPLLDDVDDATDSANKNMKAKLLQSIKSTNDYFDRRAQAKYAMLNPQSGLSNLGVRPEFKSRYSDPTHPAASGSLVGLVTGGKYSTAKWRVQRRQNQNERGLYARAGGTAVADFLHDIKLSSVIRTMRGKQVLYLVIADAPTPEELEEARSLLREMGVLKD